MPDKRDNDSQQFAERFFSFLEDDVEDLDSIREELRDASIDPDEEVAWVTSYVDNQLVEMNKQLMQDAANARKHALSNIHKSSPKWIKRVGDLLAAIKSGTLFEMGGQVLELQGNFSKLENPTDEDLQRLVEDFVDLERLERK